MGNQVNFITKLKKILVFLFKDGWIFVNFYSILVCLHASVFATFSLWGETPESGQLTDLGVWGGVTGFKGGLASLSLLVGSTHKDDSSHVVQSQLHNRCKTFWAMSRTDISFKWICKNDQKSSANGCGPIWFSAHMLQKISLLLLYTVTFCSKIWWLGYCSMFLFM